MKTCFIIGPARAGTTLMSTLLDSHPKLVAIPLEVKFYDHYYESLKTTTSFAALNEFFFNRSKLRFLNSANHTEIDRMNAGRVDFSHFPYGALRKRLMPETLERNFKQKTKTTLGHYIEEVYTQYAQCVGNIDYEGIVVKEGNHGLPYIARIKRDFPSAKFIVMARDPRDIFSSLKTIHEAQTRGKDFVSFRSRLSLYEFLFTQPRKSCLAYMRALDGMKRDPACMFVRYEDLTLHTEREMKRVAEFLQIPFLPILLAPTTMGNEWGGNASHDKKLTAVTNSRSDRWKEMLSISEICIIERVLSHYLIFFEFAVSSHKKSIGNYLKTLQIEDLPIRQCIHAIS